MLYNDHWRDVEPYSYRFRDADTPHVPLLYGHCSRHNQIEAYKLRKIQDLQIKDEFFQPQYPVEF